MPGEESTVSDRVTPDHARRERLLLYGCAAAVVVAVLAPLVRSGYVLRTDMVFVPRQPLRWDLVVPVGTLPRAVPEDALVSLSALVAPGWLAQRLALAGILAAATIGAGRLVPAGRALTRVVAALAYAWSPFVAERLLIGQWGLLICYAALPWLVGALRDQRLGRPRAGARVVLAAACACVTPTGGVIALGTVLVLAPRVRTAAAVAALNAPWVVIAVSSPAVRISSPDAIAMFAARGENWAGALAALAGGGGIWDAGAVPASRGNVLAPVITLVLLMVALAGFRPLERRWPDGAGTRLGRLAVGSLLLAAIGVLPGTSGTLRGVVDLLPGAGLLRDGQKFLMPYVLCLALCLALGAERLAGKGGWVVLAGLALLPVVALPDLAWGVGGKLRPVGYPAEWAAVAGVVAREPGPVLSLPLSAYRSYPWNPGTTVYDPAARYLPSPVIVDDWLFIDLGRGSTALIRGESAVVADLRERLDAQGPAADGGIRWVLVQHGGGGDVPDTALAGLTPVHRGPDFDLYRNPDYHAGGHAPWWGLAGYLVAGAVVAAAGWRRLNPRRRDG